MMKLCMSALFSIVVVFNYQSSKLAEQAVSTVRQMNISSIDSKLSSQSFEPWLTKLTGAKTGVTWQFTDCGQTTDGGGAVQACVETTAVLPDMRKISIMTVVGNFKQGITGNPKLLFAVIDNNGELYQVMNLRDLPDAINGKINNPAATTVAENKVSTDNSGLTASTDPIRSDIPEINPSPVNAILILTPVMSSPPSMSPKTETGTDAGTTANSGNIEAPPPSKIQKLSKVSEGVLQGNAVKKVIPGYPAFARQLRLFGEVKVEVLIDPTGNVVKAKAISGPQPLFAASIEAAKQWVFKPTTLNGSPIVVQGLLSFVYVRP